MAQDSVNVIVSIDGKKSKYGSFKGDTTMEELLKATKSRTTINDMSIFFLRAANISTFCKVIKIKYTRQVHHIYMLLSLSNVFPLPKQFIFV